MINKIRFGIAYIIGAVGIAILLLAGCCLTKEQRDKTRRALEGLEKTLDCGIDTCECVTIEDEIFSACANVYKENYSEGTNEDLTVECRMCGVNTKRGKYFKRNDLLEPDSSLPYLFICPDCYNSLPNKEDN